MNFYNLFFTHSELLDMAYIYFYFLSLSYEAYMNFDNVLSQFLVKFFYCYIVVDSLKLDYFEIFFCTNNIWKCFYKAMYTNLLILFYFS